MSNAQDEIFRAGVLKVTKDFAALSARFAEAMLSEPFTPEEASYLDNGPACSQKMFISILFTGTVYGEFILAMEEKTAANLLGKPAPENSAQQAELRGEASEVFREMLNLVVGECIVGLGKAYEKLTVTAPRVYFGDVSYPRIKTGKSVLRSGKGQIECYFLLDKMKLDIAASYKDALASLSSAHEELKAAMLKLQAQQAFLVQSEKMAALGTMAAGVAHEINSPLATVSLLGASLRDIVSIEPIDKKTLVENLDVIDKTVNHISKITSRMRAYAHGIQRDEMTKPGADELVEDALFCCEQYARERAVEIIHEGIPAGLSIECHAPKISQALAGLILNGCDAAAEMPQKWVKILVKDQGDRVTFSVIDSGRGIPAEIKGKIFDPFFTTKDVGKGAGLGLSLAKGVVEGHEGLVALEEGSPTHFSISLPKRQSAAKRSA